MKQTKKNNNNDVHLYGFPNEVRINDANNGTKAINIDLVTIENYKNEKGESQARRSFHDVVIFTDDKKLIKSFEKIAKNCEANAKNRDVEGYERKTDTVSLSGILVNKDVKVKDSDKTYSTIQVLANPESVDVNVKQEEKEYRNVASLVGNIGSIDLHEDKKFAVVSIAHHYRPKDSEKENITWLTVRVNGDRKVGKELYEAIEKGDLKAGDFIRVGGQMHNNRFEDKDGDTRYVMTMDATRFQKLEKKQAEAEKVEMKEEKAPAKKAAAKKAQPKKAAPKQTVKAEKKPAQKKGRSI